MTSPGTGNCDCNDDVVNDPVLGPYRRLWKEHFLSGKLPEAECTRCQAERVKRHRVLTSADALTPKRPEQPFSRAPTLYTFNVPRCFAPYLHAKEYAKQKNLQLTWCYARDKPLHPYDRELPREKLEARMFSWLQNYNREKGPIPSIYPLAIGMPVRLTVELDNRRQLFVGQKGVIRGWTMAPQDCIPQKINDEFMIHTLPVVIYLHFPEAQWQIGRLPTGVYPMRRRSKPGK